MAENSKIEWTDHTFNGWIGCTKVSPGCANCYADTQDKLRKWTPEGWGKGKPRKRTSEANWKLPLKWNREEFVYGPESKGGILLPRRQRVFCSSLADWLDNEVPIEWLADLLKLIHSTPNLDWLLLTKRPENWYSRLRAALAHIEGINPEKGWDSDEALIDEWLNEWLGGNKIPSNVWIGTSVEDQKRADERIPELLKIPAKLRFLSCEPLLGPVDISAHKPRISETLDSPLLLPDWVIVGGESGPGARPMHPDWARSLRDQCVAASVPFFFKQWGEYRAAESASEGIDLFPIAMKHNPPMRQIEGSPLMLMHLGKKVAGRRLDGREWNEMPVNKAC